MFIKSNLKICSEPLTFASWKVDNRKSGGKMNDSKQQITLSGESSIWSNQIGHLKTLIKIAMYKLAVKGCNMERSSSMMEVAWQILQSR